MKILAIDDDPIILDLLTQFIAAMGDHTLSTVESGPEALELMRSESEPSFDCFLVDIQMPKMDGVQLTHLIRAMDEHSDTPIVMLTAMSEKRYIDAAFAAGATDYVTKPFELVELKARLTVLSELVEKRRNAATRSSARGSVTESGIEASDLTEIGLFQPVAIRNVENLIDHLAMENYVAQLSRGALFGSTTFAFAVRRIEKFHESLRSPDFLGLITQVGEVISEALTGHQFLMSYAGNGIFLCITEQGWRPNLDDLKDGVNLSFAQKEILTESGERLQPRVVLGQSVRLVWKTNNSLMDALAEAHTSAETANVDAEGFMGNIRRLELRDRFD